MAPRQKSASSASSSSVEIFAAGVVRRAGLADAGDGIKHFGVRLGVSGVAVTQAIGSTLTPAVRAHWVAALFVRRLVVCDL